MTSAELLSSTGLPPRVASTLAYGGWWVTGLLIWWLERRDAAVRFHAAQSLVAFGAIALLVLLLATAALVSLSFLPAAFSALGGAAVVVWLFGVALWAVSLWKAASGDSWRIPLAAGVADRLVATRASAGPSA